MDVFAELFQKYGALPFLAMNGSLQILHALLRPLVTNKEVGLVETVFVHPVRALPPVAVKEWPVTIGDGFVGDKRLCILEETGLRLKHKNTKSVDLYKVKVALQGDSPKSKIVLSYNGKDDLVIDPKSYDKRTSPIEEHDAKYVYVGDKESQWLSDIVGRKVRLMFCPYSLSDGSDNIPSGKDNVHILGIPTLDDFREFTNKRVEVDRFRPNITSTHHKSLDELRKWKRIRIGTVELEVDHGTERCLITCLTNGGSWDPDIFESLKRWAPRDPKSNKPLMGSYFKVLKPGIIRKGDVIVLMQ